MNQPHRADGSMMPTMMNHQKVLENELAYTRTISERNTFILELINIAQSQSNQIEQLNKKIKELKMQLEGAEYNAKESTGTEQ